MVHRLGGPHYIVEAVRNGNAIFIRWPLQGMIQIVKKTGALWDNRNGPWRVHHEDLKRIMGYEPYLIS